MVPAHLAASGNDTDLDTLPEAHQRTALASLIESLPRISQLKSTLDDGRSLASLVRGQEVSEGAITVLRWVICSCRAYLKEVKPGQGVVNKSDAGYSARYSQYGGQALSSNIRQFTFVVGNPEQEDNFRKEIEKAKVTKPSLSTYPTMLAFHGESSLSPVGATMRRYAMYGY